MIPPAKHRAINVDDPTDEALSRGIAFHGEVPRVGEWLILEYANRQVRAEVRRVGWSISARMSRSAAALVYYKVVEGS